MATFSSKAPTQEELRKAASIGTTGGLNYTGGPQPKTGQGALLNNAAALRTTDLSDSATFRNRPKNEQYNPTNYGGNTRVRGGTGVQSTPTAVSHPGTARPSDTKTLFGSSNEWYGGLDEYGGNAASMDPGVFWDLYGTEVLGLPSGSAASAFYNENYSPYSMMMAMGNDMNSPDQRLAAGTALAQQLGQPGMTFIDPGQLVTNILSQLSAAGKNPTRV
jgi:hypothetical protein